MRLLSTLAPFAMILSLAGCQTEQKANAGAEDLLAGSTDAQAPAKKGTATAGSTQAARLVRLASDIEQRGEYGTAIALYEKAMALPDAPTSAFVKAGDAYMRAGQTQQAIKTYRAALARSPNDGKALLGLGSAMVEEGDQAAGIRALAQAAPIVNTSSAYNRLAVAQTFAGQPQAAQNTFSQALKLAPGDLDIEINMALNAALADDSGVALPIAQRIIASGKAQEHHKRNVVLVYGLLNMGDQISTSPPTGLSSQDVKGLLGEARKIRSRGSIEARAKALGSMMG